MKSLGQRLASVASETQEYSSLDSNHSTDELYVQGTTHDVVQDPEVDAYHETAPDRPHYEPATRQKKPRIKWPKASDKTPWRLLDEDLDSILEASMQGPVDRKLQTLTTLIYAVAKERYGLEETRVPRDPPNRTEGKPE